MLGGVFADCRKRCPELAFRDVFFSVHMRTRWSQEALAGGSAGAGVFRCWDVVQSMHVGFVLL